MNKEKNIQSILVLNKMVFDKIEFKRLGFSSDKELEVEIQSNIAQKNDEAVYKVTLNLKGSKPDEYIFEISLTGFFTIEQEDTITEELRDILISKNTVSILMPYLRSEVSLLTAQPGMECVVLPVFNINKMMEDNQ